MLGTRAAASLNRKWTIAATQRQTVTTREELRFEKLSNARSFQAQGGSIFIYWWWSHKRLRKLSNSMLCCDHVLSDIIAHGHSCGLIASLFARTTRDSFHTVVYNILARCTCAQCVNHLCPIRRLHVPKNVSMMTNCQNIYFCREFVFRS